MRAAPSRAPTAAAPSGSAPAEQYLRELEPRFATHELVTEYLSDRAREVLRDELAPRTVELDRRWLLRFVGECPRAPWRRAELRAFRNGLPGGAASHNQCMRVVRTFTNWVNRNYADEGLEVPLVVGREVMPSAESEPPDVLTDAQVSAVLDAARAHSYAHYAMVATLYDTGVRPWELWPLKYEELTADGWWPSLVKRNKDRRFVVIHNPQVHEILLSLWTGDGEPAGYVFPGRTAGTPIRRSSMGHIVNRAFKAAGVKTPKQGPYMLRHTIIERWKRPPEQGGLGLAYAQRFAGHSQISTTAQVYGKAPDSALVAAARSRTPERDLEVREAPRQARMGMEASDAA